MDIEKGSLILTVNPQISGNDETQGFSWKIRREGELKTDQKSVEIFQTNEKG